MVPANHKGLHQEEYTCLHKIIIINLLQVGGALTIMDANPTLTQAQWYHGVSLKYAFPLVPSTSTGKAISFSSSDSQLGKWSTRKQARLVISHIRFVLRIFHSISKMQSQAS